MAPQQQTASIQVYPDHRHRLGDSATPLTDQTPLPRPNQKSCPVAASCTRTALLLPQKNIYAGNLLCCSAHLRIRHFRLRLPHRCRHIRFVDRNVETRLVKLFFYIKLPGLL